MSSEEEPESALKQINLGGRPKRHVVTVRRQDRDAAAPVPARSSSNSSEPQPVFTHHSGGMHRYMYNPFDYMFSIR